jgi:hypothetical protein
LAAFRADRKYEEIATTIELDCQDKVDRARLNLEEKDQKWKKRVAEKREKNDADLQAMQEQFQMELDAFDVQYTQDPTVHFRKYSFAYRQLREQERHLVSARKFIEAKAKREEAHRLKAVEKPKLREKYIVHLNMRRADVVRRWEEKIAVQKANMDEELFVLERAAQMKHAQKEQWLRNKENQLGRAELLTELIPESAATSARRSPRSIHMTASCRVSRVEENGNRTTLDRFRQRRLINSVVYSTLKMGV